MTTPLTDIATVKEYMGLGAGTELDALITALIPAASAFIESWLSRTIAVATYTESYNGHGGQVLFLRHRPITSVSAVNIDGVDIALSPDTYTAGFTWDQRQIMLRAYWFTRGMQNVKVTYEAGLASNAPADVPADLNQACVELIALKVARRKNEGQASKHIGAETVSFVVKDMPDPVKTILQQYRNVVPVA